MPIDYQRLIPFRRAMLEGKAIKREEWEQLKALPSEWWEDLMACGILDELDGEFVRCAQKLYIFEVAPALNGYVSWKIMVLENNITGMRSMKTINPRELEGSNIDEQLLIMVANMQREKRMQRDKEKRELSKNNFITVTYYSPENKKTKKPKPAPSPFSLIDLD